MNYTTNKLLNVFIKVWVGVVVTLNLMGVAGAFLGNDFWTAVGNIQEWYSPFNIWTHSLNIILVSPAIMVYLWLERQKKQPIKTVG